MTEDGHLLNSTINQVLSSRLSIFDTTDGFLNHAHSFCVLLCCICVIKSLRPRQNGHHFANDIFNHISLNENVCIPINISTKFVPTGPINNIPALVQIMAWRRPGDKPLSEPRMVSLPTHICVTRPR